MKSALIVFVFILVVTFGLFFPFRSGPLVFVNYFNSSEKRIVYPKQNHYRDAYFIEGQKLFLLKSRHKSALILVSSVKNVEWTESKVQELGDTDEFVSKILRP